MPLGLFARSVGHNASLAHVVTNPAAQACVASFVARCRNVGPRGLDEPLQTGL